MQVYMGGQGKPPAKWAGGGGVGLGAGRGGFQIPF